MANAELVDFAFNENLILVKDQAKSSEEIILKLGNLLYQNNYVDDNFTQAVLAREAVHPTGLQARAAGVAVPHTDIEYVRKSAIAVASLAQSIDFYKMGNSKESIPVEIVIMLAIHDEKLLAHALRKVLFILENNQALQRIKNATSPKAILKTMQQHLRETGQNIK